MGNLVLRRKPGESIDVYDPANECFGPIIITQGKISAGTSSIAIDAPRNLVVKRSELVGREAGCKVNQKLIDNLRYVLQNMRTQPGDMAKVQADIVAQAITEIENQQSHIKRLLARIDKLKDSAEERSQ